MVILPLLGELKRLERLFVFLQENFFLDKDFEVLAGFDAEALRWTL